MNPKVPELLNQISETQDGNCFFASAFIQYRLLQYDNVRPPVGKEMAD
jgi:hypothetical protein